MKAFFLKFVLGFLRHPVYHIVERSFVLDRLYFLLRCCRRRRGIGSNQDDNKGDRVQMKRRNGQHRLGKVGTLSTNWLPAAKTALLKMAISRRELAKTAKMNPKTKEN